MSEVIYLSETLPENRKKCGNCGKTFVPNDKNPQWEGFCSPPCGWNGQPEYVVTGKGGSNKA